MANTKGEKTIIRIIEAATELFFKHGFYSVTFKQIADEVSLTQPALYKHFSGMEDLIIEAARHWVQEAQTQIDARTTRSTSAKGKLKKMIEANFKYSFENRQKDGILLALAYLALGSPKAHRFYSEIVQTATQRLIDLIEFGEFENEWKVENVKATANNLHSLMVGEISKMIVLPEEASASVRAARVLKCAHRLLHLTGQ